MKGTPELPGDEEIFSLHSSFAHFLGQTMADGFLVPIDPSTVEVSIADFHGSGDHLGDFILVDLVRSQGELRNAKTVVHQQSHLKRRQITSVELKEVSLRRKERRGNRDACNIDAKEARPRPARQNKSDDLKKERKKVPFPPERKRRSNLVHEDLC